ncbi:MAG: transporter [Anaerolineae bacterium]|nr:transporter [Gemmatimonadaceae bacterium]
MQRVLLAFALLFTVISPLRAQSLRDKLSNLFILGSGNDPLFLAGSGDPSNPAFIQAHGSHFIPAAEDGNAIIIAFITNSISGNVANIPISATSGGSTFRFEGGVPVRTSLSAGPVYGERAQTLGKGRVLVGLNRTGIKFKSLRGAELDDIRLNFTHSNVDFPGCDSIFAADCARRGLPAFENDVIEFNLALSVELTVTSLFLTYGLWDKVDVGVALPVVSTSLRGQSEAQVVPFGPGAVAHFFGGTASNPVLHTSRSEEGSATGIGDVSTRIKVNVRESGQLGIALLGDVRLPTGSEDDLLGSGYFSARGLGIVSARFGDFSPHANLGYLYRADDIATDAVLATIGFDHLLAPWATLAADLLSELQVGNSNLHEPELVQIEAPFRRTIAPTTIPSRSDDIVNASLGIKLSAAPGLTVLANAAWPLNRGGLRPNMFWTAGLEYNF